MKKTIFVQLTAGVGPTECAVACGKVTTHFINMYIPKYCFLCVDCEDDIVAGIRSVIFEFPDLPEEDIADIRNTWEGTVRFISTKNSIRPYHKRKNWYIGVNIFEAAEEINVKGDKIDLKWETMRASGPGGQHVNRTESAVRVTHIPTGITVKCDMYRDQLRNKEKALKILMAKIKAFNETKQAEKKNLIWLNHKSVERGNEKLTIKGEL